MEAKRQRALQLFVRNGMQGNEIAALLGVSQKTVSLWRTADKWDDHKAAMTTTKPQELRRLYTRLTRLQDRIDERGGDITSAEADIISKLATAIRKLEDDTGLSTTVNAFIGFNDWLSKRDLVKAKEVAELHDLYIKHIAS